MLLDRDGYLLYDRQSRVVEDRTGGEAADPLETRGGDLMTDRHIANFIAAVRTGETLRAPIVDGRKSVLLCHPGNIAHEHGGAVQIDPATGRIQDDAEAQAKWGREYAADWAPSEFQGCACGCHNTLPNNPT